MCTLVRAHAIHVRTLYCRERGRVQSTEYNFTMFTYKAPSESCFIAIIARYQGTMPLAIRARRRL